MSSQPDRIKLASSGPDGLRLILDTRCYELRSVQKAAYSFGDRCHLLIRQPTEATIEVVLKAKNLLDNPEYLLGEFCNAILDQELRQVVLAETKGVRDLLLAQAFSKTNLIAPELDTAEPG